MITLFKHYFGYENIQRENKSLVGKVSTGSCYVENGDGVMVAKTNIAKGSKLTLPPPCVLTQDKVLSSTVGTLFSGLDIYTMFSLFILWQKIFNIHFGNLD